VFRAKVDVDKKEGSYLSTIRHCSLRPKKKKRYFVAARQKVVRCKKSCFSETGEKSGVPPRKKGKRGKKLSLLDTSLAKSAL